MKLTDINYAPYIDFNSLIHIVNTGDTSQDMYGSSYKAPLSYLSQLFSVIHWSASTGTNAIVTAHSNSIAQGSYSIANGLQTKAIGDYSHAEGQGTTAFGYASKSSGYNSKALGVTSFVHSSNSVVSGNRSAILGGQSITGTSADTVYVPNLNINITPVNDNVLTQVLVRATNGDVKYKTLSSYANFTWQTITTMGATTQNAVVNTGYINNNGHPANRTQYKLPTTAAIGDTIKVMGINGRASIIPTSPQQIGYGTGDDSVGGAIVSPVAFYFGKYESVEVTYIGMDRWILSNFQTTDTNPIIDRIF
jgi:hypothetical protein